MASAANDAFCASNACINVAFQPNVYLTIFDAGESLSDLTAMDAAWALTVTFLLTLSTYFVASSWADTSWGRARLRGLQYGWLADLVDLAEIDGHFTTAFVVTTVQHNGMVLGYEGLLENLTVNSDKEITSLSLLDVTRFTLKVEDAKRSDVEGKPIPRLYLHRQSVQNVAFNVFQYVDEEPSGQLPEESLPAVHGNP
jgi:hypothetical protein